MAVPLECAYFNEFGRNFETPERIRCEKCGIRSWPAARLLCPDKGRFKEIDMAANIPKGPKIETGTTK